MNTRHLLLLIVPFVATGCAGMNNTERGALGGGVVGTAAGTAIGAATGRPLLGAALGGAVGTAGGALIGNGADKQEARAREIELAEARKQQQRMGISDVIALAQAGHSDQVIINQIRSTRSTFQLVGSDLDMLKNAGVSQAVIAEMQAARPAPGRVVVREPRPTVIYESGPVFVRPAPYYYYGPPAYGFHFHGRFR
jgi:outer membrane lipoprotein SlyB